MYALITFSTCIWPDFAANEVEIVSTLLEAGNDVTVVYCTGGLPLCRHKQQTRSRDSCSICRYSRDILYRQFIGNKKFTYLPMHNENYDEILRTIPDSADECFTFEFDGTKFGDAIMSTATLHDGSFEVTDANSRIVKAYLQTTLLAYIKTKRALSALGVNTGCIVYNGRLAEEAGALKAIKSNQLNFWTHEVSSVAEKYVFFENSSPHDINVYHRLSREYYEIIQNSNDVYTLGQSFFHNRRHGIKTNDKVYIKDHFSDFQLPHQHSGKKIVSIYTSSDHEMKYTPYADQYTSGVFTSQISAVETIVRYYEHETNIVFVLRVHPNAINGVLSDVQKFTELETDNLIVIGPNEPISSYSLLDQSSVVITFGSTIGVEATYWGKPSITLVPSIYTGIDVCFRPSSWDELFSLVSHGAMPKTKSAAVAIGAMLLHHGKKRLYVSGNYPNYRYRDIDHTQFRFSRMEAKLYGFVCRLPINVNARVDISMTFRRLLTFGTKCWQIGKRCITGIFQDSCR